MDLVVEQGSLADVATPLLVVNLFEDVPNTSGAAEALAEGTLLALYRYDQFKHDDDPPKAIERATVVERDPERIERVRAGLAAGTAMAEATMTARDLAQGPANLVTPEYLANQAQD